MNGKGSWEAMVEEESMKKRDTTKEEKEEGLQEQKDNGEQESGERKEIWEGASEDGGMRYIGWEWGKTTWLTQCHIKTENSIKCFGPRKRPLDHRSHLFNTKANKK